MSRARPRRKQTARDNADGTTTRQHVMTNTSSRTDLERNPAPNKATIRLGQPLTKGRAQEVVTAALRAYSKWDDASFRPRAPGPFEVYLLLEFSDATVEGGAWLYGKFKEILVHTDMTITVHNASYHLPPFGSLAFCLGQKRLSIPDGNFLLPIFRNNLDVAVRPFAEATNLNRSELVRLLSGREELPAWSAIEAKKHGLVHGLAPNLEKADELHRF